MSVITRNILSGTGAQSVRLPDIDNFRVLAAERAAIDPQLIAAAARAWAPNTVRAFLSDIRL